MTDAYRIAEDYYNRIFSGKEGFEESRALEYKDKLNLNGHRIKNITGL